MCRSTADLSRISQCHRFPAKKWPRYTCPSRADDVSSPFCYRRFRGVFSGMGGVVGRAWARWSPVRRIVTVAVVLIILKRQRCARTMRQPNGIALSKRTKIEHRRSKHDPDLASLPTSPLPTSPFQPRPSNPAPSNLTLLTSPISPPRLPAPISPLIPARSSGPTISRISRSRDCRQKTLGVLAYARTCVRSALALPS